MDFIEEIAKTDNGKTYRYRIYVDRLTGKPRIWSCNAGDYVFTNMNFTRFITARDFLRKWLSNW